MADPYRLDRTSVPSHYELELVPDLEAATFAGRQRVQLRVTEATDTLVLNAIDLDIDAAWLAGTDGQRIPLSVSFDGATERVMLTAGTTLAVGDCELHTEFRGTLNDLLRGFYRSTFIDEDGVKRVIACTQFQSTDARRCFPCWDEPDLKATFSITIVVPPGQQAVANTPIVADDALPGGARRVRFADTMVMSTYLVAFVVGPLEATEPVDVGGVPLRVVHVPGKGHLASFALDCGAYCLQWFVDYYGIPYPSQKVDLVALPDFAAGAMENLGCITFRESLLLVDPAATPQLELERVADVIAHELAHMWFGDLVTMKWWNGIWLNEAFATFMEAAAVDAYRPDWQRWTGFSTSRAAAFETDSCATTRPIEFEVRSPTDAEGMFDVLTYEKGASVLRMLESYLGVDRFREGVRLYLGRHAYANTETTDLFDSLEEATGEPVRRIMDSWIFQRGFPVIDVRADGSRLRISQRRFFFEEQEDATRWSVPIMIRQRAGGRSTTDRVLLEDDATDIELLAPDALVVVNADALGYYRVRYHGTLLDRLVAAVFDELGTGERFELVDDTWAFVRAGELRTATFLDVVRRFSPETEVSVWRAIVTGLDEIDRFVEDRDRPRFESFVRTLVAPALDRLGWDPRPGDRDLDLDLRGLLVRTLANLGNDTDAIERARVIHRAATTGEPVEAGLAAACVQVVAAHGGDDDYEQMWARFEAAETPQDMLRYLYALGDFPGLERMHRTTEATLSDRIRSQNAPFLLRRCLQNRVHGAAAWRFVRSNWGALNARFPRSSIVRMIEGVTALNRPEDAADVAGFFSEHQLPQAQATLDQILERLRVSVALRERDHDELAGVLPD